VKAGVVDADDVYAHLSPSDDDMVRRRANEVKTRLAAARKIGVINLLASAPPPPDDDDDDDALNGFEFAKATPAVSTAPSSAP
jgi:hypothetical protein